MCGIQILQGVRAPGRHSCYQLSIITDTTDHIVPVYHSYNHIVYHLLSHYLYHHPITCTSHAPHVLRGLRRLRRHRGPPEHRDPGHHGHGLQLGAHDGRRPLGMRRGGARRAPRAGGRRLRRLPQPGLHGAGGPRDAQGEGIRARLRPYTIDML